jgi:hypothetical protein
VAYTEDQSVGCTHSLPSLVSSVAHTRREPLPGLQSAKRPIGDVIFEFLESFVFLRKLTLRISRCTVPVLISKDFAIVAVEVFSYSARDRTALIQVCGRGSIPTTTSAEPSRPLFRFHENQPSFVIKMHRHLLDRPPWGVVRAHTHGRKTRGVRLGRKRRFLYVFARIL